MNCQTKSRLKPQDKRTLFASICIRRDWMPMAYKASFTATKNNAKSSIETTPPHFCMYDNQMNYHTSDQCSLNPTFLTSMWFNLAYSTWTLIIRICLWMPLHLHLNSLHFTPHLDDILRLDTDYAKIQFHLHFMKMLITLSKMGSLTVQFQYVILSANGIHRSLWLQRRTTLVIF